MPPDWLIPWLFWGGIALTFILAFHSVRVQRDELKEKLKPKLRIVFSGDTRPYLQEFALPGGMLRTYRVGVENLSEATIPDVRVVVEACPTKPERIFPWHMLQVMDVAEVRGQRAVSPTRGGGPSAFFDVVEELVPRDGHANTLAICYENKALMEHRLDPGQYDIILRAEGGGTFHRAAFTVSKHSREMQLVMRETSLQSVERK